MELDPKPSTVERMLGKALNGSQEAIGQILEAYRAYLIVVAGDELNPLLRTKLGDSDLVQDAFLEAHRDFSRFQGRTAPELMAWLRRIVLNNVANINRHYAQTDKRQVDLEIRLDASSRTDLKKNLPTDLPAPDEQALQNERLQRLQRALEQLSLPFQEVIQWRNLEQLSFAEIGQKMNRSEQAVHKLWSRAIQQLQRLLTP